MRDHWHMPLLHPLPEFINTCRSLLFQGFNYAGDSPLSQKCWDFCPKYMGVASIPLTGGSLLIVCIFLGVHIIDYSLELTG